MSLRQVEHAHMWMKGSRGIFKGTRPTVHDLKGRAEQSEVRRAVFVEFEELESVYFEWQVFHANSGRLGFFNFFVCREHSSCSGRALYTA